MSDEPLMKTPSDVAALPDGTVLVSTETCLWPNRYAGRRWRKRGGSLDPLDPDPFTGHSPVLIAFFKDPLPAQVSTEEQQ